jgi:hypothetical protein
MPMIYIASILTIIVLLVIYSFSDRKRNNEELQFKKNKTSMRTWEYSMKIRGIKNV